MSAVLMLGWEFPPFISGGLGTACHGLTRALTARGTRVTFVLPKAIDDSHAAHVELVSPRAEPAWRRTPERVETVAVPGGLPSPYAHVGADRTAGGGDDPAEREPALFRETFGDYGGDLFDQARRYAAFVVAACADRDFDVIHAHDWLTWPAGLALAEATGRPVIAHVHSTEFDRAGEHGHPDVHAIERSGLREVDRIITVSQLTRDVVVQRYEADPDRIDVVYNGVELDPAAVGATAIEKTDRIVLYFGRITHQKGPEYFVRAAHRALEVMPDVKFVVAGSGDMARRMIELAASLGIGHKVLFTGFLRGDDIRRVFAIADLYVMPSVSEPFGIAPLEAMAATCRS